ncbi:MAG: hypothetical protein A4E61_00386 [Syntrophorhabdus sp. PtaB.Bin184]|nr:MAG: hypothetical protein A4E61_00386 [Syntrophorhabdus sp. PtaB.Bin184]
MARTSFFFSSRSSGTGICLFCFPIFSRSLSCISMRGIMAWWPNSIASMRSVPFTRCASPSTMMMASRVAVTTISISLSAISGKVGFTTKTPPILPTLTPAKGPSWGMSEMVTAQDAPTRLRIPGSLSWSAERTVEITCVSYRQFLGKRGLRGLSMRRDVSISRVVGRPSLLKKPPGNLPAA